MIRPQRPFLFFSGSCCCAGSGVTGMLLGAAPPELGRRAWAGCVLCTAATSLLPGSAAPAGAACCCTGSQLETNVRPLP
jgi:hypothetical protein